MKEEELNTLRQQDLNLREALRLDEAELPQMPSDLNARLMQRVADEQKRTRKSTVRRIWPWLAAACVAAFIAVNIAPPKSANERGQSQASLSYAEREQTRPKVKDALAPQDKGPVAAKVEQKVEVVNGSNGVNRSNGANGVNEPNEPNEPIKPTKPIKPIKTTKQLPIVAEAVTTPTEPVTAALEEPKQQLAQTTTKVKKQTLTEHDIPITRPENYKYTPEELAQLRKQADEAYLKWVELELEISKNNLQQTAEK